MEICVGEVAKESLELNLDRKAKVLGSIPCPAQSLKDRWHDDMSTVHHTNPETIKFFQNLLKTSSCAIANAIAVAT